MEQKPWETVRAVDGVCVHETWPEPKKNPSPWTVLVPPRPWKITSHKKVMHSFTQLSATKSHQSVLIPPYDFEALEKTPHTLPAGLDTGILIHELIEDKLRGRLDLEKRLHNTRFAPWQDVIAQILDSLFTLPISLEGVPMTFSEIDLGHRLCEADFLYGVDHETVGGRRLEEGCVTGAIDFIFQYGEKVYIVDWKTNWLPGYSEEEMRREMEASDYTLQARLYSGAVERYLSLFGEKLSGVYYVFVRGIPQGEGVLKL